MSDIRRFQIIEESVVIPMARSVFLIGAIAALLVPLVGCGSSENAKRSDLKPDLALTVGYLDLSAYHGRIERKDLTGLTSVLKNEKIDIFGVTGITRYPGVATRTDFVDVVSSLNDMRKAFGLASDNSGHQIGNAVFSVYPLRSSARIPLEDGSKDESVSALLAVVDGGVSEIQIISAHLPSKGAFEKDLREAVGKSEKSRPLLILGNLPQHPSQDFIAGPAATNPSFASPIWIRRDASFELLSLHNAPSAFGVITVAHVGFFRTRIP